MSEKGGLKTKKRIKTRVRIKSKRLYRIQYWKRVGHNTILFLGVIFSILALYFLIWGLLIEPNIPTHIYGPGDLKELIYLLISLSILAFLYLLIRYINYKPLHFNWWNDLKLFYMAGFNIDEFVALKRMGIEYRHKKKKARKRKRKQQHEQPSNI